MERMAASEIPRRMWRVRARDNSASNGRPMGTFVTHGNMSVELLSTLKTDRNNFRRC